MVEALAEAGARVYIVSPTAKTDDKIIKKFIEKDLDVHAICADQSNETQINNLIQKIKTEYKTPNILVNSGVARPMKDYMEDDSNNWMESMRINGLGLFLTCRAFAKAMSKNGGSIINISSIYGIISPDKSIYEGTKMGTEPDYPYNKGGMIMFSKYLASYFADKNVRVNCVAPGGLYNNQEESFLTSYIKKVPMKRMANQQDLKGIVVFLASKSSKYITGTVIPVDGGITVI